MLGRPGAVLKDGEIAGTWRPRSAGTKLTVLVDLWDDVPTAVRTGIGNQAEQLAAHRGVSLAAVQITF